FPTYSAADRVELSAEGLVIRPGSYSEDAPVFRVEPAQPIAIPGDVQVLTLRLRSTPSMRIRAALRDGHGRDAIKDQPIEVPFPTQHSGEWETVAVRIPKRIPRPVSVRALVIENVTADELRSSPSVTIAELSATTDLSQVDPVT